MNIRAYLKSFFKIKRIVEKSGISFKILGFRLLFFKYDDEKIDIIIVPFRKRLLSMPIMIKDGCIDTGAFNKEIVSLIANLETLQLIRKAKNSNYLQNK